MAVCTYENGLKIGPCFGARIVVVNAKIATAQYHVSRVICKKKLMNVAILDSTAKTTEPSRITKDDKGTFFLQVLWTVKPQRMHWVT